ncbi:MAG: winged helix-turn-helix domain-containing protein [Acidobacteria bacterium]|nr:winged helix-turn-helix domain-containing protein [Acidobacteriota bacterium]MCB9399089.1 winged helix-turn-helix domain-containing protein [Acidobacteriota bacterium]
MTYQFEEFAYDPARRVLSSSQTKEVLRPQVGQVLLFFLERAGEVVTKEQLIQAIWGETAVSEQSLNLLISTLRKVLTDDAKNPRFLLTLPQTGYQWIAPVQRVSPTPIPSHRWRMVVPIFAAMALFALVFQFFPRSHPPPSERMRIAFWPFENQTGDPNLQWVELGLMDMVAQTCGYSTRIEVVPAEKVLQYVRLPTPDSQNLCSRLGVDLAVTTQFQTDEVGYMAKLSLQRPDGSQAHQVIRGKDPLEVANRIGQWVLRRSVPLQPNLSLFQQFTEDSDLNISYASGVQALLTDGPAAAQPFFQKCVQKDPCFLLAQLQAGKIAYQLGQGEWAQSHLDELALEARSRSAVHIEAACHGLLSNIALHRWQIDSATQHAEHAQGLFRQLNESLAVATMQGQLGYIAFSQNRMAEAESLTRDWLSGAQVAQDRLMEGQAINTLAMVMEAQGDWLSTQSLCFRAIQIFEDLGSDPYLAIARGNLGYFALKFGDWRLSEAQLQGAFQLQATIGDQRSMVRILLCQALLKSGLGQIEDSLALLAKCQTMASSLGDRFSGFQTEILQIRLFADLGRDGSALIQRLDQELTPTDMADLKAQFHLASAYYAWRNGDVATAQAALDQVPEALQTGSSYFFGRALVACSTGKAQAAKRDFEMAETTSQGDWSQVLRPYCVYAEAISRGESPIAPPIGYHMH